MHLSQLSAADALVLEFFATNLIQLHRLRRLKRAHLRLISLHPVVLGWDDG